MRGTTKNQYGRMGADRGLHTFFSHIFPLAVECIINFEVRT
jgi:hypothetical protein